MTIDTLSVAFADFQALSLRCHDSLPVGEPAVEDPAGGGRATEGGAATPSLPTTLLSLPDELLVRIFELLLALHPVPPSPEHGVKYASHFLLPLDAILLNRRIYTLALPLRQHTLFLHGHISRRPQPLFPAERLASFASHVRHLNISISRAFPPALSAALPSFTALETLRLSLKTHLPRSLTDALKKITTLRNLYLRYEALPDYARAEEPDSDDLSFSITGDLPFLQRLTVDTAHFGGEELLHRGGKSGANLQVLKVIDQKPHCMGIPWSTLRKLELEPPLQWLDEYPRLIAQIAEAVEDPNGFSIKHLVLHLRLVCSVRPPTPNDPSSSDYAVPSLLSLLQHPGAASLERIDFKGLWELDWSDEDGIIQLPSVKEVRVGEVQENWQSEQSRSSLPSFLSVFPSLTTLHLTGCALLPPSSVRRIHGMTSSSFSASLPPPQDFLTDEEGRELRKFLNVLLEKGSFVELRYRGMKEWRVELRFKRKGAEEGRRKGWVGEWYWR